MPLLHRLLAPLLAVWLAAPAAALQSPAAALAAVAADPAPEVLELQRDLRALTRGIGPNAQVGVLVVSLDRGDTLFSQNPDQPLAPASNLKLFSTAAALHYLGSTYRFSTLLLADGPVQGGVLRGDLVLYGTGDPTLSGRMLGSATAPLRAMVDSLRARGVRIVEGDVVGDGSYFDAEWTAPGWQPGDLDQWYGAPVGALSLAENMVTLRIRPGEAGGAARIATEPATVGLALENRVRTVTGGATGVRVERAGGRLIVEGQVRSGTMATRTVPVVDPANYAAAALRALLEQAGIQVRGGVRSVHDARLSRIGPAAAARPAPPPQVLAMHLSPPLAEVALITNHVSHNLFADALLKAAGRAALGVGSFAGGARAVDRLLARNTGADTAAVRVVDGSGLSRLNRLSARATIQLLDYMRRSDVAGAYLVSLPEAGSQTGLKRMYDTPAAGRLRAKTGTIRGVSSLSGYVAGAGGERLAFSIISNGVASTGQAKRVEDALGARLARFRRP